jgi:hypothetical protein
LANDIPVGGRGRDAVLVAGGVAINVQGQRALPSQMSLCKFVMRSMKATQQIRCWCYAERFRRGGACSAGPSRIRNRQRRGAYAAIGESGTDYFVPDFWGMAAYSSVMADGGVGDETHV